MMGMFIPYTLALLTAAGLLRSRPRLALWGWVALMVVSGVMFIPHIIEGHPLAF